MCRWQSFDIVDFRPCCSFSKSRIIYSNGKEREEVYHVLLTCLSHNILSGSEVSDDFTIGLHRKLQLVNKND